MNLAQVVFKAIDGICYPTQNKLRFPEVVCQKDISYGESEHAVGDLYYRRDILNDGKKHPLILYYHGGGFVMGDKKCRVSISEFYANEGYFVFCVNYRMPPEVVFPSYMIDCVNAANYIKILAEKYNIDLESLVVTGDSSGGYTASYMEALVCNPWLSERLDCPQIQVSFKGAMLMCGIYDLEVLLKGTKLMGVIPKTAQLIVGDFPLKDDLSNFGEFPYVEYMSPSAFVNEKWCSTFMCWANDDIVCQNQGGPMAEKIKAVAPSFDTFEVDGFMNNHCFHLEFSHNKLAMDCMQKSVLFLKKLFAEETVAV
ncbi:MAG: alpha/beta hydrolase [Clostridia bacterium]|nr:alpha/beta hydrolase [Clostridia bacterium]